MNPITRNFQILLIIDTSRVYGRDIVEGVAKYSLEQSNPWFVQFQECGASEKPPNWLKDWQGDGLIVRSTSETMEKLLKEKNIPYVELCGTKSIPEVVCDDPHNGRLAAEHFLERGLTHFAFFGIGKSWWVKWRGENFRNALAHFGHPCETFILNQTNRSIFPTWNSSKEEELILWLKQLPKPAGVYCDNEIHAAVVIDACRKAKINVPLDLAVLGVDNDETICKITNPQISCIASNGVQVGYLATKLLHQRMLKIKEIMPTPILVPSPYVVTRQSTDMIAINDPDVAEAIRYIRKYATSGITVNDVEKHVVISHATLFRKFRKHIGHSPEREIIRVKINFAKMLLLETSLPLTAVAAKSGITPTSYFMRVFKREAGTTPQNYRKQQKMK